MAWDRHDIRQFGKPYQLIKDMLELMGSLQPPQEQKRQIAAMILELAPALRDSLMKVERYDVWSALLPHLVGVSSLLEDKAQVAEIKKLELGFPDSEFESRKKQLKDLQDH